MLNIFQEFFTDIVELSAESKALFIFSDLNVVCHVMYSLRVMILSLFSKALIIRSLFSKLNEDFFFDYIIIRILVSSLRGYKFKTNTKEKRGVSMNCYLLKALTG